MHLFEELKSRVIAIVEAEGLREGLDRIAIETPRDPSHGDLSTNAAMVLAKAAKRNPRQLGELIAEKLGADPLVAETSVAGPGFVNIRISDQAASAVILSALDGERFTGLARTPAPQRVNVEYVSANPTGPLHVGHARGAVVGDALASILALRGHEVTREYYINDAGAQVDVLARSAYLRYREALGETVEIPAGLYPGDYLVPVGEALAAAHGDRLATMDEAEWLPIVREAAIAAMMATVREDLAVLDIRHDLFFSERSLQTPDDIVAETVAKLERDGLIYEGVLPRPKGAAEDWEDREQTLFRSTRYGDDVDRALKKSDGSYTYFASDIAYHADKIDRGYDRLIDVLGADHGGYVRRMTAAVAALSHGRVTLDCLLCQLVKLYRAGEPVKMSKRSGDFVTLRDVVDEVGADAVRFMMLYRKSDAPLDFDFVKVTEQSRDNPVFYVQYAHARCASAKRQAVEAFDESVVEDLSGVDLSALNDSGERTIAILLAQWPQLLATAADAAEPHRVAFYLNDLASALHAQWNRGKDMPTLRFVNTESRELTRARLALVEAVRSALAQGLAALGVSAPVEMR
ncbi:arginine--tRNA ligase [Acuticoccus sp. I52.16.1]|uniref:arginine--tRNA ligase n=1 Tax=Acuticoccus sp. I52.16.1 TaxID=2928472 RepID=UPI001FD1D25E|nr:arginine--tRNA ligase [Acuticoccus sp. I52.16.1]UOM34532.1 arginine--tRNA ligase [Acuticoccus sp. I52.16.1]